MPEFQPAFLQLLPQIVLKLFVAILCGLILGLEREWKDKPAGLRTIVLITVGSTLFMIVSDLIPLTKGVAPRLAPADPGRVAAQVVTGIGFLGAGTIIRARGAIHGLTTAAVIWVAAAIGLLVGIGFFLASVTVTLLVLIALLGMEPLRRYIGRRTGLHSISLFLPDDLLTLRRVEFILAQNDVGREDVKVDAQEPGRLRLHATFHAGDETAARILDAISEIPGVEGVPYERDAPA